MLYCFFQDTPILLVIASPAFLTVLTVATVATAFLPEFVAANPVTIVIRTAANVIRYVRRTATAANASRRTFADAVPVTRAITPATARQIVRTVATEASASHLVSATADPVTRVTAADASRLPQARRNADTDTDSIPIPADAYLHPLLPCRRRSMIADTVAVRTASALDTISAPVSRDFPSIPPPADASPRRPPTRPCNVDTVAEQTGDALRQTDACAIQDFVTILIPVDAFRNYREETIRIPIYASINV